MFIGHFAVGFAAKKFAPKSSLAVLLAALLFRDIHTAFAARRLKSDSDAILPIFYRIEIQSMTGYRAVANAEEYAMTVN